MSSASLASSSLSPLPPPVSVSVSIFEAATGRAFELTAGQNDPVSALKDALVRDTGIDVVDQILLSASGRRLDNAAAAGKLNSSEQIFLFDRKHRTALTQDKELQVQHAAISIDTFDDFISFLSSLVPVDQLASLFPSVDAAQAPPPQLTENAPHYPAIAQSANPILRALPEYERLFVYHVSLVRYVADSLGQRANTIAALLERQNIQFHAVQTVALNNFNTYYNNTQANLSAFLSRFHSAHERLEAAKQQFDSALDKLANTPAYGGQQTSLLDLLNANKLRQWLAQCDREFVVLTSKQSELKAAMALINEEIQQLHAQPDDSAPPLIKQLKQFPNRAPEFFSSISSLLSDFTSVDSVSVASALSEVAGNLQRAQQAARGSEERLSADYSAIAALEGDFKNQLLDLEERNERHQRSLIPSVKAIEARYRQAHSDMLEHQLTLSVFFFQRLHAISRLSSATRSIDHRLPIQSEALRKSAASIQRLEGLASLPQQYALTMMEIRRRKQFRDLLISEANRGVQRLNAAVRQENEWRDEFSRRLGQALPAALVPTGVVVNERPQNAQLQIVDFDGGLPDLADLPQPPPAADNGPPSYASVFAGHSEFDSFVWSLIMARTPMAQQTSEYIKTLEAENSILRARLAIGGVAAGEAPVDRPAAARLIERARMLIEQIANTNTLTQVDNEQATASTATATAPATAPAPVPSPSPSPSVSAPSPSSSDVRVRGGADEIRRLRKDLADMSQNTAILLRELNVAKESEELWKEMQLTKLAFTAFQTNDLALFIRGDSGAYEAFNKNAPHRFLAEENRIQIEQEAIEASIRASERKSNASVSASVSHAHTQPVLGAMFIGQIVLIERHRADSGKGENPFKLPIGTEYFKLWVELYK